MGLWQKEVRNCTSCEWKTACQATGSDIYFRLHCLDAQKDRERSAINHDETYHIIFIFNLILTTVSSRRKKYTVDVNPKVGIGNFYHAEQVFGLPVPAPVASLSVRAMELQSLGSFPRRAGRSHRTESTRRSEKIRHSQKLHIKPAGHKSRCSTFVHVWRCSIYVISICDWEGRGIILIGIALAWPHCCVEGMMANWFWDCKPLPVISTCS